MRTRALPRTTATVRSRFATLLATIVLTLLAGSPAIAASPSDNPTLKPLLITTVALHDIAVISGVIAPGPFADKAFEASAISYDFSLKFTAPTLELTGMGSDLLAPVLYRVPDTSLIDGLSGAKCTYRLSSPNVPDIDDDNARGISTSYASAFGIPYDPVDDVFSELGTPSVFHPHADVVVSVNNPHLGVPVQPGLTPFQIRDLQLNPRFPEGQHTLKWSAQAKYHPIVDGAIPITLLGLSAASENYIQKKVFLNPANKNLATNITKNLNRVLKLGVTVGAIAEKNANAQWYQDTLIDGGRNSVNQELVVWDINLPFIVDSADLPINVFSANDAIDSQDIQIEATDFGGVRFRRVKEDLMSRFSPQDLCGKTLAVSTDVSDAELLEIGTAPNIVEWQATEVDGGPYQNSVVLAGNQTWDDGAIATHLTQRITVVDTQAPILVPPSGFARYDEDGIDLEAEEFPLGRPRVVDLADPSPTVSFVVEPDQPGFDQTFLPGPPVGVDGVRYQILWDAADDSGNLSSAVSGTPGSFLQTVTLKRPGTNTPPSAGTGITANTITAEPVDILLTGIDTDFIDGSVDPLSFDIEQLPQNGQFEAPLYPYFIEDYRLTPVGEREEGDNTTRVSPLGFLAEGFANTLPENHGTYLNQNICQAPPGSQSDIEFGGVIPIEMVYEPTFVHVDDDGTYYFLDQYYVCGETPKLYLENRGDLDAIPRLSRWTEDGTLLNWVPLHATDDPNDLEIPAAEIYTAPRQVEIDNGGRLWVAYRAAITTPGSASWTWFSYDRTLSEFQSHGIRGFVFQVPSTGEGQYAVTADARIQLMFEVTKEELLVWDQSGVLDWTDSGDQVGALDVSTIAFDSEFGGQIGNDMVIDKDGNVYVLDNRRNRVHKWLPTEPDGQGGWTFGAYVGWLGSCTGNNLISGTTTPYNACDTVSGTSKGFACTDIKCQRSATAAGTAGAAVGQFDSPQSIEVDPNGVFYVADTQNSRVQRFGGEGSFAGQAVSSGTGINTGDEPGFILGNIGQPKQLSVNSTAFFVIEPDPQNGDNFVNVFKTSPFWDVTDTSAVVRYVSDFNYQGNDTFTFVVDDGIDQSAPASVNVAITRAFRPPEQLLAECFAPGDLSNAIPCSVLEDGALDIRLSSQDPDGFLADAPNGLDTHTFTIVEPAQLGALTIEDPALQQDNSVVYRYTPDPNIHGAEQFSFEVFDGALTSEAPKTVQIDIISVPDVVEIELDTTITAARGFVQPISATYSDPDNDPDHEPILSVVDWGDGDQALDGNWQNSGNFDANGREISPQIPFSVNQGMIFGSHQYDTVGSFPFEIDMSNPGEGVELPSSIASATVNVIEATVLGAELTAPTQPVDPDSSFALDFDITNHLPDGWSGLAAGDVLTIIEVPEGIDVTLTDNRCTLNPESNIECAMGDLAPGATSTIELTANVPLQSARDNLDFVFSLEIFDAGPKANPESLFATNIGIADQDGDGVIDVDDAFDADPDYSADSDGDGLPDQWELDFGLDPNIADDASSDEDGDGFTLLEEYLNGSFPFLADIEQAAVGEAVGLPASADDHFGIAVAGADFNQDGFDDALIGAPNDGARGRAHILFGGPSGDLGGLQTITPQWNITGYGRSVAAGDWDGNGYPDVAVGHSNGILIHFNNGSILDLHDLAYGGIQPTSNFGLALKNADLDGDGQDDLIATASSAANGALVYLYLSSRGGVSGIPLIIIEPSILMGDSVAVGDIDGDTKQDLLVGSPGGTGSDVFVYLGRDTNWATIPANPFLSFTLLSPGGTSQFGYRVASGADVDGDAIDDVVVAAYGGRGSIHLYQSTDNWIPAFGQSVAVAPSQTILGLDDGSGPGDSYGDQMGVALEMGHLDTDTFADVVVGGNRAGANDEGQVRLFRGSAAGLTAPGELFSGSVNFDMLGYSVAIAGDMDGDGFDDVVAGAPDLVASGRPAPDGGHVQILYHQFVAANPADDLDGDRVNDSLDNCPTNANTSQADLDGDGIGDACDSDIDGDGVDNDLDNCPIIASSNQDDLDADGLGDLCDPDVDGDGVADIDDAFPRDFDYNADSDGDGMPDAFEIAAGLDPNDGSDANGDLDGDGRFNLDEFLSETDIASDDVAPELTAPSNLVVDATGYRTPVDLGTAIANDVLDGPLVASVDNPGPYRPGRYDLTWSATDAAGNTATTAQTLDVNPLVNFSHSATKVAEGQPAQIQLNLNGVAPSYPVTLDLSVSGTAADGVDFVLSDTAVTITEGRFGLTHVSVLSDSLVEPAEDIVLTLSNTNGAALGGVASQTIRIIDGNILPAISISSMQSGQLRTDVVPTERQVQLSAIVIDPNIADTHRFDWSGTDSALVPQEGFFNPTFTFDPTGLVAGTYRAQVSVTDSGDPSRPQIIERWIRVLPLAPNLPPDSDTDGDGIDDHTESYGDADLDGTPDWQDPTSESHRLLLQTLTSLELQTDDGLKLQLGAIAIATGSDAGVKLSDIQRHGSHAGPALAAEDPAFHYLTDASDFSVAGLDSEADTVRVVVPLGASIPANAIYRLYVRDLGWRTFVVNKEDRVASAPGSALSCPAPGSDLYVDGLAEGHYCVQLAITDGGINDGDGIANRVIAQTGGVAMPAEVAVVTLDALTLPEIVVRRGQSRVPMLRFRLNSNTGSTLLDTITLQASGSGNDATDIRNIVLWADTDGDGVISADDVRLGSGQFDSDDGTLTLSIDSKFSVPSGNSDYLVTYDF